MQEDDSLDVVPAERLATRWIPSSLLDLPPLEPVFAMRTPHRVYLQAMPSSREALRQLLQAVPFEICVEIDGDEAPLRHVPVQNVHDVRLSADLALSWDHFYWLADGLQDDLGTATENPGASLILGRRRLAAVEEALRALRRGTTAELWLLRDAWEARKQDGTAPGESPDPPADAHAYLRELTSYLVSHSGSRAFADWMAHLAAEDEHRRAWTLSAPSGTESALLGTYLQHRALGNAGLLSPAGMIAGWQLLLSTALLGVWFAGLLVHAGYETEPDEALVASLWMLDQGFWCDETLVHEVLRHLQQRELTSAQLGLALATSLAAAPSRA